MPRATPNNVTFTAPPPTQDDIRNGHVLRADGKWVKPQAPNLVPSPRGQAAPGSGASVNYIHSIDLSGTDVSLVNDAASPGNSKYYGTDPSGNKGWFSLPSSGSGSVDIRDIWLFS